MTNYTRCPECKIMFQPSEAGCPLCLANARINELNHYLTELDHYLSELTVAQEFELCSRCGHAHFANRPCNVCELFTHLNATNADLTQIAKELEALINDLKSQELGGRSFAT